MFQRRSPFLHLPLFLFPVLLFACLAGAPAYGGGAPVRIGVLANRGAVKCLEEWGPTAEYLTSALPAYSFQIVPLGFREIDRAVESGSVDFVLANSAIYVGLEYRYGASRILTLSKRGQDGPQKIFGGVILFRAGRTDIRRLSDLRGKTFMAVDPTSFGGWIMAWRELKEAGVDPHRDFGKLEFGGSHERVVYAVRDRQVDAGTIRTGVLEGMAQEGLIDPAEFQVIPHQHEGAQDGQRPENFPFLSSTALYPEWPLAKVRHVPDGLANRVVIALLRLSPDNPAARAAGIAGWVPPLDYQAVHTSLRELGIGPYTDYGKISVAAFVRQHFSWLLVTLGCFAVLLVTVSFVGVLNRRLGKTNKFITSMLESLTFPFYVVDARDYSIKLANKAANPEKREPPLTCHDLTHHSGEPCQGLRHLCPLETIKETGRPVTTEHLHASPGGNRRTVAVHAYPVFDRKGKVSEIIEFCLDITDQRQAENALRESRATLQTVTDTAKDAIVMVDDEGRVSFWNRGAEEIFGYAGQEVLGRPLHLLLIPQRYHTAFEKGFRYFVKTGQGPLVGRTFEIEAIRKGGFEFPLEISLSAIKTQEHWSAVGTARDISKRRQSESELRQYQQDLEGLVRERTEEIVAANRQLEQKVIERQRAEEQLKASLEEKNILLKEIHHRVKNNMQVISSLLKMQARRTGTREVAGILEESQNRIRAMALIHEKIYRSDDLAKVKALGYIRELASGLFSLYRPDSPEISLRVETEDGFMLDIDTAIPCGLIINELVTNSLKYGFPPGRGGEIRIRFQQTGEDELTLTVSDNGVGIPEGVDFRKTESLGLHLVTILAEDQLDGEIRLDRTEGTEFNIRFRGRRAL